MAIFSEEIIIEILTRVPAKSLIRFRCVSKTWCNLICDSTFIQTHFKHALQENNLDLFISCTCKCNTFDEQEQGRKYISQMYSLDFNSSNEAVVIIENLTKDRVDDEAPLYVKLLGSCNGLVCLTTNYPFCVLNPSTREYKFVFHEFDWHYQCGLCGVHGFGYDADADVYSVVHIRWDLHRDDSSSIVHVFSLKDTTCLIAFNVPYVFKDDTKSGVYLNGALHWVAFPNSMDKRIATLVSFDMKEKEFQVLPRPDKLCEKTCFTVGLLGGYLSILCLLPTASIEIWIMKNYGVRESWNKLCSIDHTAIPPVHFQEEPIDNKTWINARLLCFPKNGEIVLQVGSDVVLYDFRQNVARKLEIHGITNHYKLLVQNVAHISSLVSFR